MTNAKQRMHGLAKIKMVTIIAKFIKKSKFFITDSEDIGVLNLSKEFACELVNYLNKYGYTIVKKKELRR